MLQWVDGLISGQGVAVESDLRNTISVPADEPAGPGRAPLPERFLYASGSRPLEGYTIKRGVGQGGFGEIYYALSDAGKEVALKLIRRNLDIELRGVHQCLNLKHPNLLALYDIRPDDKGDTWVIMEYMTGQSLADVLAGRPQGLPPADALAWIRGIGAGVAYLHDRGIVHRDLKPGNIFSDEGLVKVGDYGLSKFLSCSRRSGHTESIGTVHYMAPEVANGRYGKEIDIYALGIMLYEMLTGRVPFDGESVGEVLMKHLTAKPDLSPLAEPYRSVVARALEKDPALRYRSVVEMMAALPSSPAPQTTGWLPGSSGSSISQRVAPPLAVSPAPLRVARKVWKAREASRRLCGQIAARAGGRVARLHAGRGAGSADHVGGDGPGERLLSRRHAPARAVRLAGPGGHRRHVDSAHNLEILGGNVGRSRAAAIHPHGRRAGPGTIGLRHGRVALGPSRPVCRHADQGLPLALSAAGQFLWRRRPATGHSVHGRLRHAVFSAGLVAPGRPLASGAAANLVGDRHGLSGLDSGRPMALSATVAGAGGRHHVGGRAIGRPLVLRALAAA